MKSFLTGMMIGMLGGAAAASYLGNNRVITPEVKSKTRQVVAETIAAGCLLSKMGGQAGKIIRR